MGRSVARGRREIVRGLLLVSTLLTIVTAARSGADPLVSVEGVPDAIVLNGPYDRAQLLVLGYLENGFRVDLTRDATYASDDDAVALVNGNGRVRPISGGDTTVRVRLHGREYPVPVTVRRMGSAPEFTNHVVAAISRSGCNSGACHGAPAGKRGFRLSLRGHDPTLDFRSLTRDLMGRRVSVLSPGESLILRKGAGRAPHEGGVRFSSGDLEYQILHDWVAAGAQFPEKDVPRAVALNVFPGVVELTDDYGSHQLRVVARFGDGTSRDVTHLSVFSSSDETIAQVDQQGVVHAVAKGETAILVRYLDQLVTARVSYVPHNPDFVWTDPEEVNFIDRRVNAHLRQLEILPSGLCSDHEFLRRAYLDLLGRIPTSEEARRFLEERDPAKRGKLVEELLNSPEFTDFWAAKWLDVLGVNQEKVGRAATIRFHSWFRLQIERNRPLDEVVRELLTATGDPVRDPAACFMLAWRDPLDAAETTAQVFLGVRMQCARCHNHPFERWTQDDYYGLAAFFARTRVKKLANGTEVVFDAEEGALAHPSTGTPVQPAPLLGEPLDARANLREALAEWLLAPDNSMFSRAVVNRVWYHLFGRGLVDPPDDIRDSNPPAHERVLEELAGYFAANGYDLRALIREIMTSATYQRSSLPNRWNREDERYFSRNIPRLLTAEQLLNAVCSATGLPERFPDMPPGITATQLPDPAVDHPFLKAFGKPDRRLPCECERSSEPSLGQVLELINGPLIAEKISASNNCLEDLLKQEDEVVITELFLRTLSRFPTSDELADVATYVRSAPDRRRAYEDVLWSLLNSRQFLYRL